MTFNPFNQIHYVEDKLKLVKTYNFYADLWSDKELWTTRGSLKKQYAIKINPDNTVGLYKGKTT